FTIADFVADLRAPTPSAAAELCAPDIRDLIAGLGAVKEKLDYQMKQKLQQCSEAFTVQAGRLERFSPQRVLEHSQERLNHLSDRLERAQQRLLEQKQEQAARAMGMLEALSPLKVFGRGYSAAYVGETLIRSAKQVQAGDTVRTRLTDGEIYSTVMKTTLEGKE
ncbi:MAG: exodeoxyribonuclease VII large subunit, partial [Clostridiales bacterium]|nr:exodeoxyribonuclease VII large subunit [Clostridiales bacterium]